MNDQENSFLREVKHATRIMFLGHIFWLVSYLLMVILAVGCPIVAAAGIHPGWNNLLAGAGALFTALLQAIKPHELATGYDAGVQQAWKARVGLLTGELDLKAASRELRTAIDRTTFRYGFKPDK